MSVSTATPVAASTSSAVISAHAPVAPAAGLAAADAPALASTEGAALAASEGASLAAADAPTLSTGALAPPPPEHADSTTKDAIADPIHLVRTLIAMPSPLRARRADNAIQPGRRCPYQGCRRLTESAPCPDGGVAIAGAGHTVRGPLRAMDRIPTHVSNRFLPA